LKSISRQESQELLEAILADPQVRQKMDAIRVKIGSQMKDVQVVFSWHWWAMQTDGKVRHVFVPLDELARADRSPEAVVGLIIHELRHRRFTPSNEEVKDVINPQLPEDLRPDLSSPWHKLSNIIEDVTIDHIEDPNLPGERPYLDAMIQEFFHKPEKEQLSQEEIAKRAEQNPLGVFFNELLLAGYPPQESARMANYPAFLQEAIRKITDGENASVLYQSTKS